MWVLLLALALGKGVVAQPAQVLVLGTRHDGNAHLNEKFLLAELERLKPDCILREDNRPFQRVTGLLLGARLGIWHPSVEQQALQRHSRRHRHVPILPYDTAFDRRKYLYESNRNDFLTRKCLDSTLKLSGASAQHRNQFEEYVNLVKTLDQSLELPLKSFNSQVVYEQITQYYQQTEQVLLPLAQLYCNEKLADWHRRDLIFWEKRNAFMARRITELAKLMPGKRIVVLSGLMHKPFLRQILDKQENKAVFGWVNYP